MSESKTPLSAVWSQVTSLLESGYSLIPVRDKPDGNRPAKSPYPRWKDYQTRIISAAELWEQMEHFNTSAIAVICGKVSGNLEVIDIDVKWKPGIEAKLFTDIKTLYPELWARLRLHRSPSGGFHIPYKIIDQPPPGNIKLARREATKEDATEAKVVSFIETRGEGGIILIPPSLGYSIYKAEPIPLLTWAERCAIINLCIAYNELIKVESIPKIGRRDDDYYDENPFDHFNRSYEGSRVLLEFGWTVNGENTTFAWFTRPGSKSKERHAAFIKSKNLFWFWTTNTEFEPQKCYYPSSIFAQLKFNSDYKKTYKELVSRGYGKIKEHKEKAIVKLSKEPPPNLSAESRHEYNELIKERSELHPHGVFWQLAPEGDRAAIDRENLYAVSEALGFRLYRGLILRLKDRFLFKVEEREFQDALKSYIKEKDPELRLLILNTYEHFLQVAGKFTVTRLPLLDESQLLIDSPTVSYKFFSDYWVKITATGITKYEYDELTGYVFADKLMNRPYIVGEGGRYIDFLNKAVEFEKLRDHVLRVIGYLAHDYKDETTPYIITMTEQCYDPRMGGGSGKNLFCNLFKHITTVSGRPGEQIKYDASFFQSWNGERIYVISDAPRDFKFLFLKELSSGSAILKKLFKDERTVEVEELPKIIVNTNYSYEISDGGLKRRIIPLEFTDFFTKSGGVKVHYGVYFPKQWTEEDWAGYNQTMLSGIQEWLASNLILEAPKLTQGGWRKQFEQVYGIHTAEFIYENFPGWVSTYEMFIDNNAFKTELENYFNERGVSKIYHPSIYKVNKAIEDYAKEHGYDCDSNVQRKMNSINVKGKQFKKIGEIDLEDKDDLPF